MLKVKDKREEIKEAFRKHFIEADNVEELDKEIDKVIVSVNNSAVINEHKAEQRDFKIKRDVLFVGQFREYCGMAIRDVSCIKIIDICEEEGGEIIVFSYKQKNGVHSKSFTTRRDLLECSYVIDKPENWDGEINVV